ncbi:hypothetical protein K438DRAFT_1860657 [Mycena galopus ATCC 62051]|nr:hypothetical protein K438DRAFT_1860657 [Mycena galopus ATCC 62051]
MMWLSRLFTSPASPSAIALTTLDASPPLAEMSPPETQFRPFGFIAAITTICFCNFVVVPSLPTSGYIWLLFGMRVLFSVLGAVLRFKNRYSAWNYIFVLFWHEGVWILSTTTPNEDGSGRYKTSTVALGGVLGIFAFYAAVGALGSVTEELGFLGYPCKWTTEQSQLTHDYNNEKTTYNSQPTSLILL